MWIFVIIYQISGMPVTVIYHIQGKTWEIVGPKLHKALKSPVGKVSSEVSRLSFNEFEQYFNDDGSALFDQFEVRLAAPEDDHLIP